MHNLKPISQHFEIKIQNLRFKVAASFDNAVNGLGKRFDHFDPGTRDGYRGYADVGWRPRVNGTGEAIEQR